MTIGNISCSQNRTYLTEQEKAWNTYKKGQALIFESFDGRTDTLTVTEADDKRFPDGFGAEKNERLRVLARLDNQSTSRKPFEITLLYISSKTANESSKIDFELSIAGGIFWGKAFPIHELEEYNERFLETSFKTYNDVIKIEDNSNRVLDKNEITTIFWSKSVGYVKCVTKDGTTWELVNIIDGVK